MASSRACGNCKARHVKCDEKRPGCDHCKTLNVDCPGYADRLKFVDEGARIEQRYGKGPNDAKRKRFGQSKFRIQHPTKAINGLPTNAASTATALAVEPGNFQGAISHSPSQEHLAELQASDFVTSQSLSTGIPERSQRTRDVRLDAHASLFGAQDSSVCNTATTIPAGLDFSSFVGCMDFSSGEFDAEFIVESEQEIMFLARHFADSIASWLDLFDHTGFFKAFVPALVRTNPILRYATAAVAAKQLGRVRGVGMTRHGRQGATENYPDATEADWSYKAANYYYRALNALRTLLPGQGTVVQSKPSVLSVGTHGEKAQKARNSYFTTGCLPEICMVSDVVLAASSILSIYDCLDGLDGGLSQHFNGVQCLLEAAIASEPVSSRLMSLDLPILCHAKRACFWNFARSDYLAAYATRKRTRFDTRNFAIWHEAGLEFDENGMPLFAFMESTSPSILCPAERENVVSNSLVLILSSVANFLAVVTEDVQAKRSGPSATITSVSTDVECQLLSRALELWHECLPMEFEPYGRLQHSNNQQVFSQESSPFPEVLFSKPSSAATMQHYHFARILLLLHGPLNFESPATRLRAYRDMMKEVKNHASEICGIAAARPDPAARILMVQPLHLAGQVLEDDRERRAIVQLLQDIESDLGWSTKDRVKQLFEEWNSS